MCNHLIFVHGRAQEHKDAALLKREWVGALASGLAKSGLSLPIPEERIHFPYYGQTLSDLTRDIPPDQAAKVVVKGTVTGDGPAREFLISVLKDIQQARGISDEQVQEIIDAPWVEKGILQWEWVQGILAAIDSHVPGASGVAVALATNDVYQYLRNPGLASVIDSGVRAAFQTDGRMVVVAHSLGTVVAYKLLRSGGTNSGWSVPLFTTMGSPLAVHAVRGALTPVASPGCVTHWFNAMDAQDVVALYPLDRHYFDVDPAIENKIDVRNDTPNHHGISGYLGDAEVARRIHDALLQ